MAAGVAAGGASQHRGLAGGSVWLLTALATLRGSFPGTVQGLVTNCSYGSSDSAPREASVPGLSLAQLPLEVPPKGSSLPPRVCEPDQQPTPSPPSVSSDNKAGRALVAPGSGWGGRPPSIRVLGMPQLLSLENQHPLPGNTVTPPPQPTPSNPGAFCSLHEEHRLPPRGTHPHPSCQLPFSKRNSSLRNKTFCPKHCRRRGEKNPAGLVLSHGTSFFQKPQALGGLDTDSAIQLATWLGTDSVSELPKLWPVPKSRQDPG